MNETDKKIVDNMIKYVTSLERDIQAAKLNSGAKKGVNDIMKELERQIKNEDKKC